MDRTEADAENGREILFEQCHLALTCAMFQCLISIWKSKWYLLWGNSILFDVIESRLASVLWSPSRFATFALYSEA